MTLYMERAYFICSSTVQIVNNCPLEVSSAPHPLSRPKTSSLLIRMVRGGMWRWAGRLTCPHVCGKGSRENAHFCNIYY